MRRQVGRVAAAVAVVGAVVSGCGAGPNQAGAAAVIGTEVIPLGVVQERVAVALSPEKAPIREQISQQALAGGGTEFTDADAARLVVSRAVLHELLDLAAAAEGVVVTDADVDRALTSAEDAAAQADPLSAPEVQRENVRDDLVARALGARYVDRLGVTYDFAQFTTREEALRQAEVAAAGGPAADQVFAAAAAGEQGVELRAATNPSRAGSFLLGIPTGRIIVVPAGDPSAPWAVVRIVERRTDQPVDGESVVERVGSQTLQAVGRRIAQPLALDIGVRVNPRYGVWDPVLMAVVADEAMTATILPAD